MDPLRFGAGEAEAFHPLVKLRKHTSYQYLRPAFPRYHLAVGTRRRLKLFQVLRRKPICLMERGLNPLPEAASLRIPFRVPQSAAQEARITFERQGKLASKHLTNEPLRFILQGCCRICGKSCLKIEIEIDGCARRGL